MSFVSSEKAEESTEVKNQSEMTNSWERLDGQPDVFANIYEDSLLINGLLFGWLVTQILGNYLLIIINLSVKGLRVSYFELKFKK